MPSTYVWFICWDLRLVHTQKKKSLLKLSSVVIFTFISVKLPQTQWLKTKRIYYLTVLKFER